MKLTDYLFYYPEFGMLDSNTYVIKGKTMTVLIDPGFSQYLPNLTQALKKDGIELKDINVITNTHLHVDHCWANEDLKKQSGAKILSHPLHKKYYQFSAVETSRFFGLEVVEFKEDGLLGDKLDIGGVELEFIPSPGHSPDSVCFYCREGKFLVCGDVIFAGNTGRVDLPGGNADQLKQSIRQLSKLEFEYLLPGHIDIVSGAQKVKDNFEFVIKNVFSWL